MVIFLSYASEHLDIADQVNLALTGADYRVFFDRDSLPAGADYHVRIRKAVQGSDAFVFLISPDSVTLGSYALTELKFAREKWPNPTRHVLPVMVERTEYGQIPNYLKAVTVLEPEGNVPAEILAELDNWLSGRGAASVTGDADEARKSAENRPSGAVERVFKLTARRIAAGMTGAFGGLMVIMSVIDAGVAGISEGGLLIGALMLGAAYGVWPRA